MERAGPRRTTFDGVRARRPAPGLARAAVWIALVCAAVPFLPELLATGARGAAPGASWLLAATRDVAVLWLAAAGACLAAAWVAARGLAERVTVALDSRCLYVTGRRLERRIPRWMIEDADARAPGTSGGARLASSVATRREVVLHTTSGQAYHLVFKTTDQARRLVDALRPAASGRGRAVDSRAPARAT